MGKGFNTFMRNPYYRKMYEEAPTERLRKSFQVEWDNNPFITGKDPNMDNSEGTGEKLTKEEVEYLARFAVGGAEKAFYKKWLATFDTELSLFRNDVR